MNTRIQVEHPVTEWITGVDLIRAQFDVAQKKSLSLSQSDIRKSGHSIEVRLYAEDADQNFIPQPGPLPFLRFPHWTGVRVDSAVQSPTEISSFYDPMIAKISCWAPTRAEATERMKLFLAATRIEGAVTNRAYLLEILSSKFFASADFHTRTLDQHDWRQKPTVQNQTLAAFCLKDYLSRGQVVTSAPLSNWQKDSYALAP